MSKQQEIREGIDKVIQHWSPLSSVSTDWTPLYGGASVGQDIQSYLHSEDYYKLPPVNEFRQRLIDVRLGGLSVPQFIEWLKSYE